MREEIGALQREEGPLVGDDTRVFLRDTADRAIQAIEIVETLTPVLEVYLSAQSRRLDTVMQMLTVAGRVFVPLTFMAASTG